MNEWAYKREGLEPGFYSIASKIAFRLVNLDHQVSSAYKAQFTPTGSMFLEFFHSLMYQSRARRDK